MTKVVLLGCLVIAGCGDDGGTVTVDAPTVPPTLTVAGKASAYTAGGKQPLEGVLIGAYRTGDETAAVVEVMSDANGDYSITFDTNGQPLDGYLKATMATYMDTYVYPPEPIAENLSGAEVAMVTTDTLALVADTLCGANQQATNGVIAAIVADADYLPLAGATVACSPAATRYCYNSGGIPNRTATATDTDGLGYFFNVPVGRVTVSAMKSGLTFPSHPVITRAGVFTTTIVAP